MTASTSGVLWFTGLSGSGKTTLAECLAGELRGKGCDVKVLDGDELRKLNPGVGYSRNDRIAHGKKIAELARDLEAAGAMVIVSSISPFHEIRDFARASCKNFYEIFVATPLSVCEQRDPKGLYRKVRKGELAEFTGIDSPYETPSSPDITVDTTDRSVIDSAREILNTVMSGSQSPCLEQS